MRNDLFVSNNSKIVDRANEQGFAKIYIIFQLIGIIILAMITFLLLALFQGPGTIAKFKSLVTNNSFGGPDNSDIVKSGNSKFPYSYANDIQDLSTGYLECVKLPGVNYPRTAALDNRVARRYLAVKQDLDNLGIRLTFTWGFRTTCQQATLKTNLIRAKPGTSPHEAGRAVDVNGILKRSDSGTIIEIFQRHGWEWYGPADPPHFEIKGYTVGEQSHTDWIRKSQEHFRRGGPSEGCRGTDCGQ